MDSQEKSVAKNGHALSPISIVSHLELHTTLEKDLFQLSYEPVLVIDS